MSEHTDGDRSGKVSRREFLKMTGAAGLVVGLGSGLGGLVAACGEDETTTGKETTTTAAQKNGVAGDVIQIGIPIAMSGWFSSYDMSEFEEVQTIVDLVNQDGGVTIDGKKYTFELLAEDMKSTLDGTTAACAKLAYDRKVDYVVGAHAFFNSAATPTLEEAQIMHVASYITCTPPEINKDTPYAFVGNNSMIGKADATVKVFRRLFPDAATMTDVSPDDGAIPYFWPTVKKLMESQGFTVIGEPIGYPNEIVDLAPIAQKVIERNPDICFQCNGNPQHNASIIKAMRESGWFNPYGGVIGVSAADVVDVAGKKNATNFLTLSMDPNNPGNPEFCQRVIDILVERWGEARSINFNHGISFYSLYQCMKNSGSLAVDDNIQWWEKADGFETLLGPGKVGGEETYGLRHAIAHPAQYNFVLEGEVVENEYQMDVVIP